jgi:protease I
VSTDRSGTTIAFVVSNEGIEEAEMRQSWEQVVAAGASPKLVITEDGEVQLMNHLDRSGRFPVDVTNAEAR